MQGNPSEHARALQRDRPPQRRSRWIVPMLLLWGIGVAAGNVILAAYSLRGGKIEAGPEQWPSTAWVEREPGTWRLLMFAHPRCPCTRASISELARLLTNLRRPIDVSVHFFRPEFEADAWARTDLWDSAAAIPGVQVASDPGGRVAELFGAATSGFVCLYDADGALAFRGGITAARGHEGQNAGEDAIFSLVHGRGDAPRTCNVYGCPLRDEPVPGSTP